MILRRYMTRQVVSTTALVLGFLVVLLLGGRLIRYFGIAAEGRLDVGLLFSIIGYNLPYFLELVLPLSFFIGLMLVFGRLYVDHEMAVINSSGISRGRLARMMIPFILFLFIIEAGLSLYGKPWGVRNSDSIWEQQSLSSAFDLIRPQSFISSDDYHLYVGSMNEDRTELQDVILVQTADKFDDSNLDNSNLDNRNLDNSNQAATLNDSNPESLNNTEALNTDQSVQNAQSEQKVELPSSVKESSDLSAIVEPSIDQQKSAMSDENVSLENDDRITAITNPIAAVQDNEDSQSNENAAETTSLNKAKSGTRDVIVLAKRAEQVSGSDADDRTQLDLYQGRRYEVGPDSLVYNQVSFERYRISINTPPKDVITDDNVATQTLPVLWRAATGHSLPEIGKGSTSDTSNNRQSVDIEPKKPNQQQILAAQAELGYRLSLPWLIFIAPMLAVPLAQVRPRQGRWLKLIPAILIFASCALVIISLKNAVTSGSLPLISYPLTIIAFVILALYLNWASRIHHRVRFRLGQRAIQKQQNNTNNKGGRS